MDVVFDRVVGLDIGKKSVVVCVRTPGERGRRVSQIRTFRTMTRHVDVLGDWLVEEGVQVAAMESTATYWKPVFYGLEDRVECWLLNAAHMKAVPGRKTDVRDAEWIAQLVEHGLVRPSFVPAPPVRRLRNLTRYRVQLMGTGPGMRAGWRSCWRTPRSSCRRWPRTSPGSSRQMLAGLVAGERDAAVLADMEHSTLRRKIPDLTRGADRPVRRSSRAAGRGDAARAGPGR